MKDAKDILWAAVEGLILVGLLIVAATLIGIVIFACRWL
jgi:hypothetical protein